MRRSRGFFPVCVHEFVGARVCECVVRKQSVVGRVRSQDNELGLLGCGNGELRSRDGRDQEPHGGRI